MSKLHAIPTTYKDVRFRSRLEARWARFFDLVHWPWQYEPIDLAGYIPDFLLMVGQPVLVEVKPSLSAAEFGAYVGKIERSGWDGEALLVGATVGQTMGDETLGLLAERDGDRWDWAPALWFRCDQCGSLTFRHETGHWRSRICGHYEGNGCVADDWGAVSRAWRKASNDVQWNAVKDDYPDWDEVLP